MKEYIERDRPFSLLKNYLTKPIGGQYNAQEVIYLVDDLLSDTPAADVVEVRHGHWVLSDTYIAADHCRWNVWTCSECGYRRKAGWEHTEDGRKPDAQYCEHCMAKMDGGVNDGET